MTTCLTLQPDISRPLRSLHLPLTPPSPPPRNFFWPYYFFISFLSGISQSPRIAYFPGVKRPNSRQAKNSPTSTYCAHILTYALKCFPSLLRAQSTREMSEIGIHAQEWVQNEFTVVCLAAECLDYGWHCWPEWWRIYEKRDSRCNFVIKREWLLNFPSELQFRNGQIELSLGSY